MKAIAEHLSDENRKVSPKQVATRLLEEATAKFFR